MYAVGIQLSALHAASGALGLYRSLGYVPVGMPVHCCPIAHIAWQGCLPYRTLEVQPQTGLLPPTTAAVSMAMACEGAPAAACEPGNTIRNDATTLPAFTVRPIVFDDDAAWATTTVRLAPLRRCALLFGTSCDASPSICNCNGFN